MASRRKTIAVSVIGALVILAAIFGAIAVTAWVRGERSDLEFQYEGFD